MEVSLVDDETKSGWGKVDANKFRPTVVIA